jgi:hypothetical protein
MARWNFGGTTQKYQLQPLLRTRAFSCTSSTDEVIAEHTHKKARKTQKSHKAQGLGEKLGKAVGSGLQADMGECHVHEGHYPLDVTS